MSADVVRMVYAVAMASRSWCWEFWFWSGLFGDPALDWRLVAAGISRRRVLKLVKPLLGHCCMPEKRKSNFKCNFLFSKLYTRPESPIG